MPLRGGTIKTAEEKLKQTPPSVRLETTSTNVAEARQSDWANQSILLAIEGHRPWLTTCKCFRMQRLPFMRGDFPLLLLLVPLVPLLLTTAPQEKVIGRLTKAKESTLDYRLNRADAPKRIRPNPISLRGWTSLIKEHEDNSPALVAIKEFPAVHVPALIEEVHAAYIQVRIVGPVAVPLK